MKNIKIKEYELVFSWNEAEELLHSLTELTDDEIIECREALKLRAERIVKFLGNYVTEDNVRKYCGD